MATDWDTWAQLYYDGAYNVLPDLVDAATRVKLERGVKSDLDLQPGFCSFRLNDPSDRYRPSNAASDLYGQTGQYMRGAFATGGSVRFTGDAQWMNPGETDDHQAAAGATVRGNRWVDVQLGGPLARVGAWSDTTDSALFTSITGQYATNLRGHFTLEDGRDSTQLANVSSPTRPGRFSGITLGVDGGPGGSATVAQMSTSSWMTFPYAPMSPTAGFQMAWASKNPTVDGTLRDVFTFRTSVGYTWSWKASTTNYSLRIVDSNGTVILDETYGSGAGAAQGQWIYTRLKCRVSGGNVLIDPSWYAESAELFYGVSTGYAGSTLGAPVTGNVTGNAATDGALYTHHFVTTTDSDNLESGDFTSAFLGHRGETPPDRFARLCTARGLPYVIRGTSTVRMGAQPIATMQDHLKEIRATEGGLIFDRGDNIGLVLACRDYLYDQAADPVLDLTYPDDVAGNMVETTTAADTYNLVTAKNANGSSAVAELAAGRYGTADPPTGSGRLDKTINVNLESDGDLAGVANWWMRYFTQGGPRFDQIVLDMDAHPELLTACNDAEPGMFARITGRTPDPLLLLLLSTGQDSSRVRNVFTFKVGPGAVFDVAILDDASTYIDSGSCTLAEDLTTSETAVDVDSARLSEVWSQTGTPYDWNITGERMTVTAMGAPSLVGAVWRQTATVTRSVNGVVKTHDTGESVQLADPKYIG